MSEPKTTTLNKLRSFNPCPAGWAKLLRHLGKTKADYAPLQMLTILESNGWDDAVWCLRALHADYRQSVCDFACDCAERVLFVWEEWAGKHATEHKDTLCQVIKMARARNKDAADDAVRVVRAAAAAADVAVYAAINAVAAAARAVVVKVVRIAADDAADAAAAAARAVAAYAAIYAAADATAYAAVYAAERTKQEKLFIKHFG